MHETAEPAKLDHPQAQGQVEGDTAQKPPHTSQDLPIAPILAPPIAAKRTLPPSSLLLASILLSLVAGTVLGALVMRHRAESRKILVAVNGVKITDDQLFTRLKIAGGLAAMHQMVQEELQLQFARKKGLAPTDAQVQARYDKIGQQPGFMERLGASRMPLDTFKQRLRLQMVQQAVLSQGVTVSQAEIRVFYRQQTDPHNPSALFYRPATVELSAIATMSQGQAERALKELNSDTPFGVAASEYSVDPSKSNGGMLAPLVLGRSALTRDPSLEAAVFNLRPGTRIGPVLYLKQWWIFQCVEKSPAATTPFVQAEAECREGAMLIKGKRLNAKRVETEFQAFERSSNLQAFRKDYQPALENVQ